MTPQEHISTNYSHYDDPPLKYNTKDKLLGNIKCAGVDMSIVKEDSVFEMQDIDRENLISVTKIIRK